jgi:hypothetical protein
MSLYDKLLANPLPGDMEALLLEDGIRAAARAALPGRADGWYVRLSRLRAGRNPAGE